jgi:hypothetical protein
VLSSRAGERIDAVGQDWFRVAATGKPVVSSLTQQDGGVQWVVAHPQLGADGRVRDDRRR